MPPKRKRPPGKGQTPQKKQNSGKNGEQSKHANGSKAAGKQGAPSDLGQIGREIQQVVQANGAPLTKPWIGCLH